MSRLKGIKQTALAIVALVMLTQTTAAASSIAEKAKAARDMTTQELYRVYKNRSWIWKDGGGYFRVSKRQFTAWVGKGKKATVAKGIWYLPDRGKTCFRATWLSTEWSKAERTCFLHRTDGDIIYQRKLPDGEWYVFKNKPVQSYDEIQKLRHGDYVSLNYTKNMRLIKAGRPSKDCRTMTTLQGFLSCLFKK